MTAHLKINHCFPSMTRIHLHLLKVSGDWRGTNKTITNAFRCNFISQKGNSHKSMTTDLSVCVC